MTNKLRQENSPYLLQHANNPVDWYPWGSEALGKAKLEAKPIFLSIGYSACHWCHVMAHESFEDVEIAKILNQYYICIKVDREERPDIDSIYMDAVVAMTGQGGWPLSVFLTPEGLPFYGGTYYPPVRRFNMPSFSEILLGVIHAWQDDQQGVISSGMQITEHIKKVSQKSDSSLPITETLLNDAIHQLSREYDWKDGGWGPAPKFPQPITIEFLLIRAYEGDSLALQMATHALDLMAKGGMYDVIGGGFCRYSTDSVWLVPHFEKMLYDNALLSRVYLHAYMITGNKSYLRICEETLDFIIRELMAWDEKGNLKHGGFLSSLDADSEGEEGRYYLWTKEEITEALCESNCSSEDISLFLEAFGVTENGNFEDHVVLQQVLNDETLAAQYNSTSDEIRNRLTIICSNLLLKRGKRIRPGIDDKVLASWNALAILSFSEAARYLMRQDYLDVARRNADFLLSELYSRKYLFRSWRNHIAQQIAFLEDYAAFILALISLYQTDPDNRWYKAASNLANEMIEGFLDPKGGFFDTHNDQEPLIVRPKGIQDNATPSGNAMAMIALLSLSRYSGDDDLRMLSINSFNSVVKNVISYPKYYLYWLCAYSQLVSPSQEVAILGHPDDPDTLALRNAIWHRFQPHTLVAVSNYPPAPDTPKLLQNRHLLNNKPSAFVCQNFTCNFPTNSPIILQSQLFRS